MGQRMQVVALRNWRWRELAKTRRSVRTHGDKVSTVLGNETIMLGTSKCRLKDNLEAAMPSLWSAFIARIDSQGSCESMSELVNELVDEQGQDKGGQMRQRDCHARYLRLSLSFYWKQNRFTSGCRPPDNDLGLTGTAS
jgi:hypothetical protein